MAEALPQHSVSYYCHQCSATITPNLEDFTCPTCHGGFIEEVEGRPRIMATDPATDPQQDFESIFNETPPWLPRFFADGGPHVGPQGNTQRRGQVIVLRDDGAGNMPQHMPGIGGLLEQILSAVTFGPQGGSLAQFVGLHGNPGDYVWGAGGMDEIITQLMNQMGNVGPPPASKEDMDKLERIKITQEHVDQNLQCNVCFEDYSVGEENIIRLPCQHCFHQDCITPWLTRNGTCPICRKTLQGEDTSCVENAQSIPETLESMGLAQSSSGLDVAGSTPSAGPAPSSGPNPSTSSGPSRVQPRRAASRDSQRGSEKRGQ